MSALVPSLRPEPRRFSERGHRENGWYIAPDPTTGEVRRWMRATTFAHLMSDDAAVARWRRRKVAEGLALRALEGASPADPAPLVQVREAAKAIEAAGDDWRKAKAAKLDLDDLCEDFAAYAGAGKGSSAGTDIHSLTEWYDAGRIEEIEVPIEYAADLAAYIAAMQDSGIVTRPEWLERVIVNRATSTCGTTDKVLLMPDGRVVIGDLKTQQSISFGWQEIAMQLAQYAYGDGMLSFTPDGNGHAVGIEPMPEGLDRAKGLVIWLPVGSGRVEFHEIDLAEGWDDCLFARDLLRRRARTKALGRRWVPIGAELAQLTHLIREAPARESLRALITDASARGLDTRELRELANRRWEALAA